MRIAAPIALVLVCACSLGAQMTATISRNGQEVRIRNSSPLSLAAYGITVKATTAGRPTSIPIYSDTEIDTDAKPLLANQDRVIMGGPAYFPLPERVPAPRFEEPVVTAGIYADGSTTGDTLLLHWLLLRRSSTLLAVETSLEALTEAERQGASRYDLIVRFKRMTESLHRWYLGPELQIGLRVYQPILGQLVNMQKGKEGSPDPLAVFLEEETAALRRQRIKLSESQPSLAMLH